MGKGGEGKTYPMLVLIQLVADRVLRGGGAGLDAGVRVLGNVLVGFFAGGRAAFEDFLFGLVEGVPVTRGKGSALV